MESNKWDELKLDSLILPQFSAKQRERLKHAGFLGLDLKLAFNILLTGPETMSLINPKFATVPRLP